MAHVLHIIDTLSGAGPTRSLQASVECLKALGQVHEHSVATLRRSNYPPALLRASKAGMAIHQAPTGDALDALIPAADIVLLHYWNSPAFISFLARDTPPHRRLGWFKILGRDGPQLVSPLLLSAFDAAMVTSEITLDLPAFRAASHLEGLVEWVPGMMEPHRLDGFEARPHPGFVVSYIGTVNASKLHPDFLSMSAAAAVPDIRFIVCGAGDMEALRSEAQEKKCSEKFEFRGYVENIRAVLEVSDVFGYPLCQDTWATSDKSVQEAMLAEVPPVVFPHGGITALVQHQRTGLVVHSASEYAQALEYLHRHPEERRRLGANAREFVTRHLDGRQLAGRIQSLFERLLATPRREHVPLLQGAGAATRFAALMLQSRPEFSASLGNGWATDAMRGDAAIAASSVLMSQGEGGIVQFRNACPQDPALLLWSGLVQAGRCHWPQALAEFARARTLAPGDWRLAWYEAVASRRIGGPGQAAPLLADALDAAAKAGVSEDELIRLAEQCPLDSPAMFPLAS